MKIHQENVRFALPNAELLDESKFAFELLPLAAVALEFLTLVFLKIGSGVIDVFGTHLPCFLIILGDFNSSSKQSNEVSDNPA